MVRPKIALPSALRAPASRGIRYVARISNGGLLLTLLALVILFSLLSRHFASPSNILLILMQMTPLAIVVAGQTLVIITGGIDMSVGSLAGLTSIIAATLMTAETGLRLPPLLAIAAALLAATLIGWGHGWLITCAGLSPFVVTFGSYSLIRGLALVYSNASPIPIPHGAFNWMSTLVGTILPIPIVVMVLVFLGMSRILNSTKLGRYAYAIGGNETVARLSGVNVNRYKAQVYAISGFLAGLSGILLMTRIESGAYTSGEDYALNSIAAVIIGGASLRGGSGSIWGSLLGVLLLTIVSNGLGMLNVSSLWNAAVIGGLILAAALIDVKRRQAKDAPAVVRAERPRGGEGDSYLSQLYANLRETIISRLACQDMRLYLVDRETGDLIRQGAAVNDRLIITEQHHLARQVSQRLLPLWIDDIDREPSLVVERIKPNLRSAIAVPLIQAKRGVGVLELQSPYSGVFSDQTADQLLDLTRPIVPALEKAWLLESGWLLHATRDALRHLWDEVYLGKSALAAWTYTTDGANNHVNPAARGKEMQRLLLDVIEATRSKEGEGLSRAGRRYQVLYQTYVEGLTVDEITDKLSISRRQYFYDLKDAVEAIVHMIVNQASTPARG